MAIYKMDSDGTDPVLLKDFENAVALHPGWRGTPQQGEGVDRTTEEEPTEQALKDWQALPEAELQTYMDQINKLIREDLRESEEDSPERRLAEKKTIDVLGHLDTSGKEDLVRFLAEADVVQILDLNGADLSGANLIEADLESARGVTDNQLAQAKDLSGAEMPDGSIHPSVR